MCEILYRWQSADAGCVCGSVCERDDGCVFVCVHVQYMGVYVSVQYIILYMWLWMQVCTLSAFQESVRRTWHLCNLWHSKDFQLLVSSCMAKQQREESHNYKGLKTGCVTFITCRLLTLDFMPFQWLFRVFIPLNRPNTDSYGKLRWLQVIVINE